MRLPVFAYAGPKHYALTAVAALVIFFLPIVLDDPFFILVLQSLALPGFHSFPRRPREACSWPPRHWTCRCAPSPPTSPSTS
jgi:hypothetical protein